MAKKHKQLSMTLEKFYSNPIAKVSLELFLSIGAILFFAMFAIRPTLLTMSDLLKEIDDKKELNKKFEQKVAALSSAQTVYLGLQDRIWVVDGAIPNKPETIKTVKIIEKVASEQGLAIERLGLTEIPDEEEPGVPFERQERKAVSITAAVVGDYQSLRSFIEELRSSQRSFVVSSITFSVEENRGYEDLTATLNITAPYFGKK